MYTWTIPPHLGVSGTGSSISSSSTMQLLALLHPLYGYFCLSLLTYCFCSGWMQWFSWKDLSSWILVCPTSWQPYCMSKLLENVEHCGGEPEQAANMHMNRLSFVLKWWAESERLWMSFMHDPYLKRSQSAMYNFVRSASSLPLMVGP